MAAAGRTCALSGCKKAPFPSPDSGTLHLACGNLHHQLLMAARFHAAHSEPPHRQIFDRNAAGRCASPSCSKPPHPGSSWCSRSHVLRWLFDFTSSLHPDQVCQISGCTRHVFVDKDLSRWRFCGWRHWQKHIMQSALQHERREPSLQDQQASSPFFRQQANYNHEQSLESRLCNLMDYVHHEIPPCGANVDKDFFHKHPWDICTGGDICWLIVPHKGTRKQRGDRVTKDGFHWKQQGRSIRKKNGSTLKYFSYRKLQDKQSDPGCSYFLDEYTVANVERFALIKLRKGSVRRKHCKDMAQPCIMVPDDTDAEDIPSWTQDEMSMESFYLHLLSSPTHNDLEEVLGTDFQC